jgi:hypothetical protein
VKNLALQQAFGSCPVVQSAQGNAGCSLFPPSWSSPAFLLPASAVLALWDRLGAVFANFA